MVEAQVMIASSAFGTFRAGEGVRRSPRQVAGERGLAGRRGSSSSSAAAGWHESPGERGQERVSVYPH